MPINLAHDIEELKKYLFTYYAIDMYDNSNISMYNLYCLYARIYYEEVPEPLSFFDFTILWGNGTTPNLKGLVQEYVDWTYNGPEDNTDYCDCDIRPLVGIIHRENGQSYCGKCNRPIDKRPRHKGLHKG